VFGVATEYCVTVHDLPEAMMDRLAARCSNAGWWGSSDCMGMLTKQLTGHLFIAQQLPKQPQAALAVLPIPVVTHRGSGPPTHRDVVTGRISVSNTPGVLEKATAGVAFGLLLALLAGSWKPIDSSEHMPIGTGAWMSFSAGMSARRRTGHCRDGTYRI
jgi:hypothetical protein